MLAEPIQWILKCERQSIATSMLQCQINASGESRTEFTEADFSHPFYCEFEHECARELHKLTMETSYFRVKTT
ncbi:hypothetical protein TUM4637_39270 [Shewanella hafniensis]|nr:hypothetical protein TUM4637_39270 [Shewanella hafniensis]